MDTIYINIWLRLGTHKRDENLMANAALMLGRKRHTKLDTTFKQIEKESRGCLGYKAFLICYCTKSMQLRPCLKDRMKRT